ncbi:Metallo-beta-lactamase [Phytophthora cactorum]|nr:Metallo-beta-lactamase [Phytophthora cactorum]
MWTPALLGGAVAVGAWLLLRPLALYRGSNRLSDVPALTLLRFSFHVRLHSLILWISGVSRNLPSISNVDQLPGQVLRVLGNNPSRMTLRGTNVYMRLLEVCQRHGVEEISDLLVTHGHLDHQRFPAMKVWKYLPDASREGDGDGDRRLRLTNKESRRLGIKALKDGQEFQVPGCEGVLRTVYTPGHCNDHVCFVLDKMEELKAPVLFSGDCVLGFGSCVFDSLANLMTSLEKLKECVDDAPAKILEYIRHRQQREFEVLEVLKRRGGLSSSEIVDKIYEPLPFMLRLSARKAVEKHLQKLLVERQVRQIRQAGWFQSATYTLN